MVVVLGRGNVFWRSTRTNDRARGAYLTWRYYALLTLLGVIFLGEVPKRGEVRVGHITF